MLKLSAVLLLSVMSDYRSLSLHYYNAQAAAAVPRHDKLVSGLNVWLSALTRILFIWCYRLQSADMRTICINLMNAATENSTTRILVEQV